MVQIRESRIAALPKLTETLREAVECSYLPGQPSDLAHFVTGSPFLRMLALHKRSAPEKKAKVCGRVRDGVCDFVR
jgi:hypothetical protein